MADNIQTTLELNAKDNTKAAFAKLNTNLAKTNRSTKQFDTNVRSLQGTLLRATTVFAAFTAGAIAFTSSIGAARQFGQQMAEVSTLIDDSKKSMIGYRDVVDNLVMTYGGTFQAASKALYDTISAGQGTVASANKVLMAANTAAIAGVSDIATSVDALTTVLNSYSYDASRSTEVTDILFKTIKAGKTTLAEMAPVLGQVTATAAAMNVTFAEVGAVIATATSKGIFTSQAITGLKAALSNIVKPTKDAVDMAAQLGIQFDSTALKSKGFTRFLEDILMAADAQGISATDAMEKLFGSVEALNTMFALVANNGEVYNSKLREIQNSSGATQKAFTKMTKTFAFQWEVFLGKIKVGSRSVGEVLTDSLIGPLTWFNENAETWAYKIGLFFGDVADSARYLGKEVVKAFEPWRYKLNWIIDNVITPIKKAFKDLYIAVVGSSYVPDLVDGVIKHFDRWRTVASNIIDFLIVPLELAFKGFSHILSALIDTINLTLIPLGFAIPDLGRKIRDAFDVPSAIKDNFVDVIDIKAPVTKSEEAIQSLKQTLMDAIGPFAAGGLQIVLKNAFGLALIPLAIRGFKMLAGKVTGYSNALKANRAIATEAMSANFKTLQEQKKFLDNNAKYNTNYGRALQKLVDQGGTRSVVAKFFGGDDEWTLAKAKAKDAIGEVNKSVKGLKKLPNVFKQSEASIQQFGKLSQAELKQRRKIAKSNKASVDDLVRASGISKVKGKVKQSYTSQLLVGELSKKEIKKKLKTSKKTIDKENKKLDKYAGSKGFISNASNITKNLAKKFVPDLNKIGSAAEMVGLKLEGAGFGKQYEAAQATGFASQMDFLNTKMTRSEKIALRFKHTIGGIQSIAGMAFTNAGRHAIKFSNQAKLAMDGVKQAYSKISNSLIGRGLVGTAILGAKGVKGTLFLAKGAFDKVRGMSTKAQGLAGKGVMAYLMFGDSIKDGLAAAKGVEAASGDAFDNIAVKARAAVDAMPSESIAMMAMLGPAGMIAAGATLIYKHWDDIKAAFDDFLVWAGKQDWGQILMNGLETAGEKIKEFGGTIGKWVMEGLEPVGKWLVDAIKASKDEIIKFFKSLDPFKFFEEDYEAPANVKNATTARSGERSGNYYQRSPVPSVANQQEEYFKELNKGNISFFPDVQPLVDFLKGDPKEATKIQQINNYYGAGRDSYQDFLKDMDLGYANGGYVSGPGTATSDSIPTMLSDGEYVVNAKSTAMFHPLLERINNGEIKKKADGGDVDLRKGSSMMDFFESRGDMGLTKKAFTHTYGNVNFDDARLFLNTLFNLKLSEDDIRGLSPATLKTIKARMVQLDMAVDDTVERLDSWESSQDEINGGLFEAAKGTAKWTGDLYNIIEPLTKSGQDLNTSLSAVNQNVQDLSKFSDGWERTIDTWIYNQQDGARRGQKAAQMFTATIDSVVDAIVEGESVRDVLKASVVSWAKETAKDSLKTFLAGVFDNIGLGKAGGGGANNIFQAIGNLFKSNKGDTSKSQIQGFGGEKLAPSAYDTFEQDLIQVPNLKARLEPEVDTKPIETAMKGMDLDLDLTLNPVAPEGSSDGIMNLIKIFKSATASKASFGDAFMAEPNFESISAENVPGFASGGIPPVNQVSLVGEKGPELFVPGKRGRIHPNSALKGLNQPTVNVNQTLNITEAMDPQAFQQELARNNDAVVGMVQEAYTKRGSSKGPHG